MNKGRLIQLSAIVLAGTLAVMPVSASILNGSARFLKTEMKNAEKRSKFCSAPIHRNLPILSQLHKGVSHLVGVKSLYKTINDLPATVADSITDISFINGAIRLVIKTPLKPYITNSLSAQTIMRAGVKEVAKEAMAALPDTVSGPIKDINTKSKGIIADVAMDVAMGDRPSIASLVYDKIILTKFLPEWVNGGTIPKGLLIINSKPINCKKCDVNLLNAYIKAVFCKICQPMEDAVYGYIKKKIEQYADEK